MRPRTFLLNLSLLAVLIPQPAAVEFRQPGDSVQSSTFCRLCDDGKLTNGTGGFSGWVFTGDECTGYGDPECVDCDMIDSACEEGTLIQIENVSETARNDWLAENGCFGNQCSIDTRFAELTAELESSPAAVRVSLIVTAISKSEGSLFLNVERSALQSFGCKGVVAHHMALSADLVAAIGERLNK
jgi:hypothetical protein